MFSNYKIYNQLITSDIEIPFLEPVNDVVDPSIIITKNKNLDKKYNFDQINGWSCLNLNIALIKNINSKIAISNGHKIEYMVNTNSITPRFLINMLHGPFAYAHFQKKNTVLHGCAIEHKNKAYLICGPSGSGKSTIASNLLSKYRFLSEDICSIYFKKTKAYVKPSFPVIISDTQSINFVKTIPGEINRGRKINIIEKNIFCNQDTAINKIIFLISPNSKNSKINIAENMNNVIRNSFRPIPQNTCLKSEKVYFKNLMNIIQSVDFEYVTNERGKLNRTIEKIESHIND